MVCGAPLSKEEECLCIRCNMNLPRTGFHLRKDNPVECLFWGRIPVLERASSFLFYRKGSDFRRILHLLKYSGYKELGEVMGRYMAAELISCGFFDHVDVIVPVPLHKKKQKLRGYNQSEWIARGISSVTGIPLNAKSVINEYIGSSLPQLIKSFYANDSLRPLLVRVRFILLSKRCLIALRPAVRFWP